MNGVILAVMNAWRDGFAELGMPTAVEDVLKHKLGDWQLSVQAAGFELFKERGDEILGADKLWRIQYPEQAKLEPAD